MAVLEAQVINWNTLSSHSLAINTLSPCPIITTWSSQPYSSWHCHTSGSLSAWDRAYPRVSLSASQCGASLTLQCRMTCCMSPKSSRRRRCSYAALEGDKSDTLSQSTMVTHFSLSSSSSSWVCFSCAWSVFCLPCWSRRRPGSDCTGKPCSPPGTNIVITAASYHPPTPYEPYQIHNQFTLCCTRLNKKSLKHIDVYYVCNLKRGGE